MYPKQNTSRTEEEEDGKISEGQRKERERPSSILISAFTLQLSFSSLLSLPLQFPPSHSACPFLSVRHSLTSLSLFLVVDSEKVHNDDREHEMTHRQNGPGVSTVSSV